MTNPSGRNGDFEYNIFVRPKKRNLQNGFKSIHSKSIFMRSKSRKIRRSTKYIIDEIKDGKITTA